MVSKTSCDDDLAQCSSFSTVFGTVDLVVSYSIGLYMGTGDRRQVSGDDYALVQQN